MKVPNVSATGKVSFAVSHAKWMVVDDTEAILLMTAKMLRLLTDAEICCFLSAKEALRVFQADPSAFELVVTDFDMPEMNGSELGRRLRAIAPKLKTVLFSGRIDISEAKALELGFEAFLPKPFSMASVLYALIRAQVEITPIFNSASSPSLKVTSRKLCT